MGFGGFLFALVLIAALRAGARRLAERIEPPRPRLLRLIIGGKQ